MDSDGKDGVTDTASACKRRRRTNSKDETGIEYGSEVAAADGTNLGMGIIGEIANEAVKHNNNNNNCTGNKLKCLMQNVEGPTGRGLADMDKIESSNEELPEKMSTENESCSPRSALIVDNLTDGTSEDQGTNTTETNTNSENVISIPEPVVEPDEAEFAILANIIVDSDNDTENGDSRLFNRGAPQRTRAFHSTSAGSNSSSTSSSGDRQSDNYSSDNDTDVDDDGSVMSVVFGNSFSTSSNEDNDFDDVFNDAANPAAKEQVETAVNKVMCKSKPSYNWNFAHELMLREQNLFNRVDWRGGHTSALSFGQGYYASRQVVERMKLTNCLNRHRLCVNCLSFNRTGDLICSGSDDLSIVVWDWANAKPRHCFKSGHCLNIFQTKFIDSAGCLDIVSCGRDGMVRRTVIPPSGSSSIQPMRLYSHIDAVHKLVLVPQSRHEIMSAGEDAEVYHLDLRTTQNTSLLRCVSSENNRRVRLFSISHHPFAPEFCISGSDDKLRVYDKRKVSKPVHEMAPKDLQANISQITCAVYNHSGSEILASYSDAGIYLFDSRNYQNGEYLHSYEGHINSRTIKGVNFFGPRSEYIVSGSDCGNIFFWDKNTEAIINFVVGDSTGVVNCLEQHPWMPVLATSGLDHNVKIWTPSGLPESEEPRSDALKETLQRNFRRSILEEGEFDINQIHYFIRHLIEPRRNAARGSSGQGQRDRNFELFSSSSNSSSSSISSSPRNAGTAAQRHRNRDSSNSSSDEGNADPLSCRSQ